MTDPGQAFLDRSRRYLVDDHLSRIRRCLEVLPDEDLWWRPNEASNSVGNLLLHLSGNVQQWVISGIGGAPDIRDREREFSRRGGWTGGELLELLEVTLGEAEKILSRLRPRHLLEKRTIQGREVTVLEAVYHVVEHLAMHTGQVVYIVKTRTGRDLGFYRMDEGIPRENW